jgi:hypothetical protein
MPAEFTAVIALLRHIGYESHAQHAACQRVASLPTPGTYCVTSRGQGTAGVLILTAIHASTVSRYSLSASMPQA